MKFIYYTNNIVYGTTVMFYLTLVYGMYMQVLLGILQVLFFFVMLFNFDKFNKNIQQHLKIYGTVSLLFLIIFFAVLKLNSGSFVLFFVVPMLIATYFTYIVYQLKKYVL